MMLHLLRSHDLPRAITCRSLHWVPDHSVPLVRLMACATHAHAWDCLLGLTFSHSHAYCGVSRTPYQTAQGDRAVFIAVHQRLVRASTCDSFSAILSCGASVPFVGLPLTNGAAYATRGRDRWGWATPPSPYVFHSSQPYFLGMQPISVSVFIDPRLFTC
jgi:hypothetical protein